ncbi:MAG: radical SAM family heme chaperone HemW [Nitrospinota bacterium]|nr:MAG: radical SAM family heme chaperone HemW [Nitrospinota bacterium]
MLLSLYIHIPFCASRCPYCDFTFVVRQTHLAPRYVEAVIRELRTRMTGLASPANGQERGSLLLPTLSTIYFGGGTPSLLSPQLLGRLLTAIRSEAEVMQGAEITVEANPGDSKHFAALRELGVNRLSLGVQALDDRILKALGRLHTAAQAEAAFEIARASGFHNINIDLIFGAPQQSVSDWEKTLAQALALAPEHLSLYGLTIEPGTAFSRRWAKGRLPLPSEDEQALMYEIALDRLAEAGYEQYEISNFARPGYASVHNLTYWERKPYLGLGVSAHSFLHPSRFWNTSHLLSYMEQVEQSGVAVAGEEVLSDASQVLEQILLGLRRPCGVPQDLLTRPPLSTNLDRLLEAQLLEKAQNRVRLTRRGLLLADVVCAELVRGL